MIKNSNFHKNIRTGLVPVLQEGVIDQLTAENSRWLNKKSQLPKRWRTLSIFTISNNDIYA